MGLTALAIIAADRYTKEWVVANLALGESMPRDAPVRLTYVANTGAAFGIMPQQSLILVVVAFLVIGIVLFYQRYLPAGSLLINGALGLQLGGAVGNLIDRLRYGYVVDFIDVRVWPIFNVADFCISSGVALLAYFLLFSKQRQEAT